MFRIMCKIEDMKNPLTSKLSSIGIVVILAISSSKGQTIVNTYDLMSPIDSVYAANIELQGTVSTGNGVFTALNSGLGLGTRLKNSQQLWIICGYNFASEQQNLIYQTGFINIRHHSMLTSKLGLQIFLQSQFNSALLLTQRNLVGFNLSRSFLGKNELQLKSAAGIFYENELYTEGGMDLLRANLNVNVNKNINDVIINGTVYLQPDVQNLQDYRLLGELAIALPIRENISLEIESAMRFDSDPHLDLLPVDFSSLIGMTINL